MYNGVQWIVYKNHNKRGSYGQNDGGPRKSKRKLTDILTQELHICTKSNVTLHACTTMKLDHDLRKNYMLICWPGFLEVTLSQICKYI